jgi:flagellar biosynthesis protein FlhG
MIVIASGKGGVGKTALAVNLAVASANSGLRTLLVDADWGLANVDIVLNLAPHWTLADFVGGRVGMRPCVLRGPGGISVLPGSSGQARMAGMGRSERERLLDGLKDLASEVDLVLVDAGAGIGEGVVSLAAAADDLVVVSTPEPTAVTDAYATLKVAWQAGCSGRMWIWMNMARTAAEGDRMAERISSVARRFLGNLQVGRLATIEEDPAVRLAVRRREPFVIGSPRSQAAVKVAAAARALAGASASRAARAAELRRLVAG